jgi:iron complex outermembrane receptor protein
LGGVTQGDDRSAPFLLRKRRLVQFAVTGPRSPRVRAMIPSNAVRNRIPSITNRLGFALAALGLIAVLVLNAASPAAGQTATQVEKPSQNLKQIDVIAPRRKPRARRATPGRQPALVPAAIPVPGPPADQQRGANTTPLNTNVISESTSRLGLTPRETPATVEVIDQQTLKDRGLRTTTEAIQAAAGVTVGEAPGAPSVFTMRGFAGDQINTLYNSIKIGPATQTGRPMDVGNLQQIEIIKGPASLLSGEGATGGAINYVTKKPHTGKIENEAFTSYDTIRGFRSGYGSGGSTAVKGLDYRFDITRSSGQSFIDDTYSKLLNISGQLDYRITNNFKVWGAVEHKEDKDRFYWGTPLVPANAPGIVPTKGVVHGRWTQYYPGLCTDPNDSDTCFAGHAGPLNPVTVDARTLRTTYNVLDNRSGAKELWLRGGFDWDINRDVKLKSQAYSYTAHRFWFNNEINAFNDTPNPSVGAPGEIARERLSVDHRQRLYGNITDLIWNANFFGMENRAVTTFAASTLQFNVMQDDAFTEDSVSLVNPIRGVYGFQQTKPFFTHVTNISLAFEDRLKLTRSFTLIGGVRIEDIKLDRIGFDKFGVLRTDGFPVDKSFKPLTGRIGYTWEPISGLTFYSQYATAADPTIANIFIIKTNTPVLLTTSRTYETGVKQLSWDKRAEWTFSAFDIERKNVYVPESGQLFSLAGKIRTKGIELAGAANPFGGLKLWGNVAFVQSQFVAFDFIDGNGDPQSYSGHTPPNIPRFIANAGAGYRFATPWPLEVGASVRHVGNRFNFQDNLVVMDAYNVADAYVFVDIPKWALSAVDNTRLSFRVRNLTNKLYASWGDPGYTDQIILGSPRSYEVAASFKW